MADEINRARMVAGEVMLRQWKEAPPDVSEWRRALDGCAELYRAAARHLEADPPRYGEAARIIATAVATAEGIWREAQLAYVLSGQATDAFMEQLRDTFRPADG